MDTWETDPIVVPVVLTILYFIGCFAYLGLKGLYRRLFGLKRRGQSVKIFLMAIALLFFVSTPLPLPAQM